MLFNSFLSCGLALAFWPIHASAQDTSNAQPSPSDLANLGVIFEASQHADPAYTFYAAPANYSRSLEPGVILSLEDATPLINYTIPSSLTLSRMIYTTADINGTVLPASAYILWPYTPPSSESGYPLVAWSHGTSGFLKNCAPSNYRSLQYQFMIPFTLALQGVVVVAPDYAGLGIDSLPSGEKVPHPWVAAPAQANDLAYAVTAARAAYPSLLPPSGSFVAMGHSQGGRASWGFTERQANTSLALDGYKGTVSFAPPAHVIGQLDAAYADPEAIFASSTLGNQQNIVHSVSTVFPSYNYSGLTEEGYDLWFNIYEPTKACLPTNSLIFSGLNSSGIVKENWWEDPTVQEWVRLTDVGDKKFAGPHLIIAGDMDRAVSVDVLRATLNDTCDAIEREGWGEDLEYVEYVGLSHFSVIQGSQEKWLSWVMTQLGSENILPKKRQQGGCRSSKVQPIRTSNATFPSGDLPNWLVSWVDPMTEIWKLSV